MTPTDNAVFEGAARRYALGALDDEQSFAVEERIITDPAAYDILLAVGDDLMEEYLDEALPAEDRHRFETHFLAMPEHRERLRLLRALRSKAASTPARLMAGARGLATAAIVVIAASAAVGTWFVATRSAPTAARIASQPPAAATNQVPRTTAPDPGATGSVPAPSASTPDVRRPATAGGPLAAAEPPAGPPAFQLRGGLTRSAGTLTRVAIPAGARTVRLVLATDTALAAGTYRLAIEDVDGEPVYDASVQRGDASGAALALNVPAEHLPRGDYRLVLSSPGEGGAPQTVATFPFRVIAAAAAP